MDATKIGAFIAAERRAKGWTQRQLADNSLPATHGSLARSCAAAVPAQCWPGCCCLPQRFYLCNFCGC